MKSTPNTPFLRINSLYIYFCILTTCIYSFFFFFWYLDFSFINININGAWVFRSSLLETWLLMLRGVHM